MEKQLRDRGLEAFPGTGHLSNRDEEVRRLRRELDPKQAGLFRRFVKRDTYVEGRVEADKQMLRDFYLSRGYVDMRTEAVNAELTEERDGVFVAYNITEGQQFRFGEVKLESEVPGLNAAAYRLSLIHI